MGNVLELIWSTVIRFFRSRASLEAEILTLRHQLNVLRRNAPKRLAFSNFYRLIFRHPLSICPARAGGHAIVKPDAVIRWHRADFRSFWRSKSRCRGGRSKVSPEIRQLIQTNKPGAPNS